MEELHNLQSDDIVRIEGREFKVLGRVGFVTMERDGYYEKVFMTNDAVLIVSDDGVELGFDKGEIAEFNDLADVVEYAGVTYKLDEKDYQLVKEVFSGDARELEGECWFWNYVADDGGVVSVGKLSFDERRADVVSRAINVDEIIINE